MDERGDDAEMYPRRWPTFGNAEGTVLQSRCKGVRCGPDDVFVRVAGHANLDGNPRVLLLGAVRRLRAQCRGDGGISSRGAGQRPTQVQRAPVATEGRRTAGERVVGGQRSAGGYHCAVGQKERSGRVDGSCEVAKGGRGGEGGAQRGGVGAA